MHETAAATAVKLMELTSDLTSFHSGTDIYSAALEISKTIFKISPIFTLCDGGLIGGRMYGSKGNDLVHVFSCIYNVLNVE